MKTTTNKKATEVKVNLGGLDGAMIYTATGKIARATHNAERHLALSGKTVSEALATRLVNAQDIKYDLARGFITLEPKA
tara:strand:+ start:91 stop:327 length:237 start_codon:yes stop_codon:yes gene_type:complete